MKFSTFLALIPFLLVISATQFSYSNRDHIATVPVKVSAPAALAEVSVCEHDFDLDNLPQTLIPSLDPDVQRFARGILAWKNGEGNGVWFECGRQYTKAEMEEAAQEYGQHIIRVSRFFNINPWGIATTIAKESGFDRCAVGKFTRDWARSKGLLPGRIPKHYRRTISHAKDDVLKALDDAEWRRNWRNVDLGLCQILYPRYYRGDPADLLSIEPGLDIQVKLMKTWENTYNTDKPWLFWLGHYSTKRQAELQRLARLMGAKKVEIDVAF
jgi:hypothetical protein